MLEVIEKWEKTRLLNGVQENLVAGTAFLLENQRLFNEKLKESVNYNASSFRRNSIPLARRIFPCLKSHQNYNIESKLNLESSLIENLNIKGSWVFESTERQDFDLSDLEAEAKSVADLADVVKNKIDSFIESQAPFNTFFVQCFNLDNNGNLVLHYDQD